MRYMDRDIPLLGKTLENQYSKTPRHGCKSAEERTKTRLKLTKEMDLPEEKSLLNVRKETRNENQKFLLLFGLVY